MNLWVALESLARTDMYADIISCVKDTVPAAVCIRYIYRIVRNYVEDCSRCGIRFDFALICIRNQREKWCVKQLKCFKVKKYMRSC